MGAVVRVSSIIYLMTLRQGLLFTLLAAIFGGTYLLIKYGLEGFSPPALVCGRLTIATFVLAIVIYVQKGSSGIKASFSEVRARPRVAFFATFTSIIFPFMLISLGELVVPSGVAAILVAPVPLFVAIFAPFIDTS